MERPPPEQLERLRQMTPGERWQAASKLYWSARRLRGAFIQQQHPEWSEERVLEEVKKVFSRVRG